MADVEKIILTLAKNKMKVLADYFPSSERETINADDVMQKLESMGVKVGIKKDVINHICNSSKHMSSVIVADAIPPQVGEDARIENYIDLNKPKTIEREDGSIDFKNVKFLLHQKVKSCIEKSLQLRENREWMFWAMKYRVCWARILKCP